MRRRAELAVKYDLYRKMHRCSLPHLNEAKAYYHVDADPGQIKEIDETADDELISYMDEKHARQLLHYYVRVFT